MSTRQGWGPSEKGVSRRPVSLPSALSLSAPNLPHRLGDLLLAASLGEINAATLPCIDDRRDQIGAGDPEAPFVAEVNREPVQKSDQTQIQIDRELELEAGGALRRTHGGICSTR